MTTQFLRKCSLIVYNPGDTTTVNNGLDLSELRIRFKISQSDIQTPNTAMIRVYNLSDKTEKRIKGEFQRVALQAGYQEGQFGVIFDGTVKQVMFGHESAVDSYADIFGADGDLAYTASVVNASQAAGATPKDKLSVIAKSMGLSIGYSPDLPPTATARGSVQYGLARDYMRQFAEQHSCSWSIQNGKLVLIPLNSYLPGEAVVLNSQTGLIGFPQQTPGGIYVRCLLNPKIAIGGLIQIDNKAINQGLVPVSAYTSGRLEQIPGQIAKISDDGFYKALVIEHSGDTRGQEWYTDLTCLAVDKSAADGSRVKPYWAGGSAS